MACHYEKYICCEFNQRLRLNINVNIINTFKAYLRINTFLYKYISLYIIYNFGVTIGKLFIFTCNLLPLTTPTHIYVMRSILISFQLQYKFNRYKCSHFRNIYICFLSGQVRKGGRGQPHIGQNMQLFS